MTARGLTPLQPPLREGTTFASPTAQSARMSAVANSPPQKSCSGLRLAGRPSKAAFSAFYGRRDAGRYIVISPRRLLRRTAKALGHPTIISKNPSHLVIPKERSD